ncbi:precorrin-3B synthase [Siculibacillus lacustris]|uniref:Precorrin-3B synthase n=1 Tax=Siculibacillus lacustris TaxID=1549641 RepID=A0A4Q9VKY4_9HYPH|nr:precorrin-3B synthase [Siculibacillus lacustris]TBW35232.1 precorrin-3B synthase [Siculibacillus lacustris]
MTRSDHPDPALVRGWCPGARRPMESGDGFLVRLRLSGGVMSATLAGDVADLARRLGSGLIDLTQRANLQIRGVAAGDVDELIGELDALGVIDPDAASEAVRNIVASPLAGLDASAPIDGRALTHALEAALVADPALHALPPKFGFVVDDGGRCGLGDVAADVRLTGLATPEGPRVLISIADRPGHARPIAVVAVGEAAPSAVALARAVVRLRADLAETPRRMPELIARVGLDALLAAAGFGAAMAEVATLPRPGGANAVLGDHTAGPVGFLGLGAPYGRLTADRLALIGDLAGERGSGELRLTPWRAVLIPGIAPEKMGRIRPWLTAAQFITSADDPRLAVVTCAGSSGCRNGGRDTRADAERLAGLARRLAPGGTTLHLSGCEKGCARPGPTPITLTARGDRYDLIRDGRAWDAPWLAGLTLDEAASALADLAPF